MELRTGPEEALNETGVPCSIPWSFMLISEHVKKVVACPYHTRPYGDLEQNTLEEIWNGPIAQAMRSSLLKGDIPEFCQNHSVACPVITQRRADGYVEPPTAFIEVGENDFAQLGNGWYGLENVPDAVRWTSRRAGFRIVTRGKTKIHLQGFSLNPRAVDEPTTGSLLVGSEEAGRFAVDRVGSVRLSFLIPAGFDEHEASDATILVDNPWCPAEVLKNNDQRKLGLAVKRLWTT